MQPFVESCMITVDSKEDYCYETKIAIIIAGSILVLSFSLTGCGSEQQTSSETESASQTVSQQSSSRLHPILILPRKL